MTNNPFKNALGAFIYICGVVTLINYGSRFGGENESIIAPIAMLSLLVLSVSVMAYMFFLAPIRQYLDGKKEEAIQLLLKTMGSFALITSIALLTVLLISQ